MTVRPTGTGTTARFGAGGRGTGGSGPATGGADGWQDGPVGTDWPTRPERSVEPAGWLQACRRRWAERRRAIAADDDPPVPGESTITMPLPDGELSAGGIAIWTLLLVMPILQASSGRYGPFWLLGTALVGYGAWYVTLVHLTLRDRLRPWSRYLMLAGLLGLGTVLTVVMRPNGTITAVFLAQACAIVLPLRVAFIGVLVLTVAAVPEGLGRGNGGTAFDLAFSVFVSGLVMYMLRRLFGAIAMLRQVRRDLARAAVAEERLRFSRDLHDLLGHTLSLIVVKAEVVRRLAPRDPAATAQAAADIEQVGRQALAEVREAVTGYRQRALAEEVDQARAALAGAGIETTVRMSAGPLDARIDALLGWAVREGATNAIRHSRARSCEIELRRADGAVLLAVSDDGAGPVPGAGPAGGTGLRGLAERFAAVGGTVTAAARTGGGFRLAVTVPYDPAQDPA